MPECQCPVLRGLASSLCVLTSVPQLLSFCAEAPVACSLRTGCMPCLILGNIFSADKQFLQVP